MQPEPRGMTLGDAMALSVGVAVAIALPRFVGGWGYFPGLLSPEAMLMLAILTLLFAAGMAVSFAILARSMRYGRQAGPGEWLAMLLSAFGIVELAPNLFQSFEQPLVQSTGMDFSTARWLIAGGWTVVILAGLGLLALGRHLPAWIRLAAMLALSAIALGGPFTTLQKEGPFLLNPVEILGNTPLGLFLLQCCELVATTPVLLMVAGPTMALLSRWPIRGSWRWTEWAGPILCLPTLGFGFLHRPTFFPAGSGPWYADQAFGLAWLLVVAVIARGIVRRWGRSSGPGEAQPPWPEPIASSPARARAT